MATIKVEVVFARADKQTLLELDVEHGATIERVLQASGIYDQFPRDGLEELQTGIWGRLAARDTVVKDGDRVEVYRPLERDPREARRARAALGDK